jgi:ANTAR domain-containing protein
MLALADSVLELYSAADLATVEAGVLDLAISVVPCGFAGLAATRADTARAFAILRRYSQDHNVKLTEVAASLLSNRDLPSPLRDADGRIHR